MLAFIPPSHVLLCLQAVAESRLSRVWMTTMMTRRMTSRMVGQLMQERIIIVVELPVMHCIATAAF